MAWYLLKPVKQPNDLVPGFYYWIMAMLSLVLYCTFHVSLIAVLTVTFYSLVFQSTFHNRFVEMIAIPRGRTVIELDRQENGTVTGDRKEAVKKTLPGSTEVPTGPAGEIVADPIAEKVISDILDIFDSFPKVEEKHGGDPRKFIEETLLNRIRFYKVQTRFKRAVSRATGQENRIIIDEEGTVLDS